jgi:hypothetical protein
MECGSSAQGVCHRGKNSCRAGAWSECQGAIEPTAEVCDAEELDENCDGVRNEGCACTPGAMKECGKAVGICKKGMQTCDASGAWGTQCEGEVKGQPEICDGKADEDCDGIVDNGCECTNGATDDACVAGMGICARGSRVCADGKWGPCKSVMQKTTEVCDGDADEDCDGRVDNGCTCVNGDTKTCQTGRAGPCGPGTQTCERGSWSTCKSIKEPGREVCDGEDNDCDGRDDASDTDACPSGQECTNGRCVCVPIDCGSRQCGSNGCGGTCGSGCSATPPGGQPPCRSSQCDDATGTCRETRPVTCYADSDRDSHGSATNSSQFCTSCPVGWTTNSDDCDDGDANVHPGQKNYFSTRRGNGSFDYDCVGGDQHEQVPVPSGCGSNTCSNGCSTVMAPPAGACGTSYQTRTCFDSCEALATCSGNTAGTVVIKCH